MASDDHDEIYQSFREAVNMTPASLEKWLESEEAKSVGQAGSETKSSSGGKESKGHESGRKIVEIKRKKKADLTEEDYAHMKKVTAYVSRHVKQRPDGDVTDTRWRYSLMNWGHDPKKD